MNNWAVIFATAVIFGAGVVTGGLLVNHVEHSRPRNIHHPAAATNSVNSVAQTNNPSQPRPPRLPEILSKDFVEKLADSLQLAPEQRAAIEKIIADGQAQMRKAVQAVRQDARQKIRDQLRQLALPLGIRPLGLLTADESAGALLGFENPADLKLAIGPHHRIRIDGQIHRHLTDRGQLIPRRENARRHRPGNLVDELPVDGDAAALVQMKGERRADVGCTHLGLHLES